jgi:hypothetical protein
VDSRQRSFRVALALAAGYGQLAVTFPIAFPNACFQVVITDNGIFHFQGRLERWIACLLLAFGGGVEAVAE